MLEHHGRQALSLVSSQTMRSPQIDYIAQMIRGSVRLKEAAIPVANPPQPEATTAEEVLADALRELEGRAVVQSHQYAANNGEDNQ